MSDVKRYTISLPNLDGYDIRPWEPGLFHAPTKLVLASDYDALRAEAERLRGLLAEMTAAAKVWEKDAERYRWLRSEHGRFDPCICACAKYKLDRSGHDWVGIADLDATIDAARAGDTGVKP